MASATIRGTSAWQCGHQCARYTTAIGFPVGAMVMSEPSNSDWPVSVGTVMPIALSLPLEGKSGRAVPVTCTGATSTAVPLLPPLPLVLVSEPPDATTAMITATTTSTAIPPRMIHVRLLFFGGGGGGAGLRRVFVRELMRSP